MQRNGTAARGHLIIIILGASLIVGACSGAATGTSGAATPLTSSAAPVDGTTAPTDPPAGGSALPTDPTVGGSTGLIDPPTDVCAPFAGGARPPATAEQTALVARMPKTVDGEPVRDPKAYPAMQVLCSGADDGDELVRVMAEEFGADLRTVVLGQFGVTVDSYSTLVEVIHAPGQDRNGILLTFVMLGGALDPARETRASVGGKDVSYIEVGGGRRYQYVDGDTIWTFAVLTEGQAATILEALG